MSDAPLRHHSGSFVDGGQQELDRRFEPDEERIRAFVALFLGATDDTGRAA